MERSVDSEALVNESAGSSVQAQSIHEQAGGTMIRAKWQLRFFAGLQWWQVVLGILAFWSLFAVLSIVQEALVYREHGVTVPWPRNERGALAGLKTISYGENVRALAQAKEAGAGEAIFPNTRGELCEGTGTNVFVVTGNVLRTPPEESGCLLGVTRALILELADRLSTRAEEVTLPISALATADEAFSSSSTREV